MVMVAKIEPHRSKNSCIPGFDVNPAGKKPDDEG
jgi:hypothetical protein